MIGQLERISDAYLRQQKILHARPEGYGGKGSRWAETVDAVCQQYDGYSVLDYGCGRGTLATALRRLAPRLSVREYDPAIKAKADDPSFADVVVCTDVLEHIEPEKLDSVLRHLHMLARKAVFVVVATRPASKVLADGRNAHLIIESPEWWDARITAAGFTVHPPPDVSPEKKPGKAWIAVLRPING